MGRQREFDVDKALDDALCVFWKKGFEGTSYTDLTQALGVQRPALYSAFGNKEALFLQALERYYQRYQGYVPEALLLPTSKEVVSHILSHAVELVTRFPEHAGCLGVHGALAGADDSQSIRQAVFDSRAKGEALLRERLERAQMEGDLPATADCTTLAAYVCAVIHGMSVQAKAGFSREKLQGIADFVIASWPSGHTAAEVEISAKAPE